MPVTIRDLARELGVSVTTVSRALNGYDDVAEETRRRVKALAQELNYTPTVTAQQLRTKRTNTLGFVIPTFGHRFSDPFFSELLVGIGNAAAQEGFDLLVSTRPPGSQEMEAYRRMVQGRRVDGLLIVRTRHQDERIRYLLAHHFPFVAHGRSDVDGDFPYIDVDGTHGFQEATAYLIRLGHRRIAFITASPVFMFVSHRLEGYYQAMAAAGLPIDPHLLMEGDLTEEGGYSCAHRLLSLSEPPTAILCMNDLTALGAMQAIQERGLVVGQDVSVIGYDDISLAARSSPPLTTLRQPIYETGKRICRMLIHLVRGEPLDTPRLILTPQLIVRQSTGPVPSV